MKINIPNGVYTMEQMFGKHSGIMDPGCRLLYCSYKKICVMVSKNTIRFKCPVTNVPTRDNVRIALDIGVNFHIGRNTGSEEEQEEDIKKFFYNFGPNRLEELLQEECEEGIRNFIKKIRVVRVRDVKTELTTSLLADLVEKFSIYGVVIEQVNIMNVILPRDLRVCLMETTNYDVYLQKQVKWQENKLLIVTNNENKAILKLKRDNMQVLFKLQHDFDVEEINALETAIRMETDQQIKKINAMNKQSCKLIDAENQKFLAEIRSKKKATILLKEAEAYEVQQKTLADTEVEVIKENAQSRL